jgi:hypothetical protein
LCGGGGDGGPSGQETRGLLRSILTSDIDESPPPIFDQPLSRDAGGLLSNDLANVDGSVDA